MKRFLFALLFIVAAFPAFAANTHETAYQRVMRTGTIRCGYFEEVPFTIVDPNTGKKSGIAVELAETVAAQLGLKVEWAEPIKFATIVTDLESGRYDAVCGSLFNMPRGGRTDYTTPFIYMPSYGYVRPGEKRFSKDWNAVNDKNVTMAILDGEGSSTVAQRLYPQAKQYALPQVADISEMLLAVANKKADIAFVMPSVFAAFDKTNPGKLVPVKADRPFYVFSLSFGVNAGETELKNMFDFMIRQLIVSGEMDSIIDKYEGQKGTFLRVHKPYQ